MDLEQIKSKTTWAEASGTMNNNNAKITEAIERLESAVENGTGGGVADSVAWKNVTNKPAWITDSKPVYGKTDLSESVQSSLNKADTALQEVPPYYATFTDVDGLIENFAVSVDDALDDKVDKVKDKQLSTEDFTSELKEKLEGLNNYNDADITAAISSLQTQLNTLVDGNASEAIETFNEIITFLEGIEDSEDLSSIIASIEQQIETTLLAIPTKVSQLANDKGYITSHQDISHLATKTELQGKQDKIADLDTIRGGAAKGATALQSVPDGYATDDDVQNKIGQLLVLMSDMLELKVDKVEGKQLSTEDFTTALKTRLEGLEGFDATQIETDVQQIKNSIQTILTGTSEEKIDSFADIILFFDGISQGGKLSELLNLINLQFEGKQDVIGNLSNIEAGAAAGATAVQPNDLAPVAFSGSYNDLSNKPTIPSAVTPNIVQGWGFYAKPLDGIPVTDLSEDVINSLDKANSALQSVPSEYVTSTRLRETLNELLSAISISLESKVDKEDDKQLSTEDFTTELKEKLERLSGTAGEVEMNEIREQLNTIMYGGNSGAIDSFVDMVMFLNGISDSLDLKTIIDTLREAIARKQSPIEDLDDIRAGAAKGATAVQPEVLDNYLPLTGGNVEGDFRVMNTSGTLILVNTTNGERAFLSYRGDSKWYISNNNWAADYKLWHEGNFNPNNYLPLTGGTIADGGLYLKKDLGDNLDDWFQKQHDGPFEVGRKSNSMTVAIGVTDDNFGYIQSKGMGIISNGDLVLQPASGGLYYSKALCRIWHEGNDGSGSGLDADTLDGMHGYSFFRSLGGFGDNTDFNNVIESGVYINTVGNYTNYQNEPFGHGYLLVFNTGNGYAKSLQIATPHSGNEIKVRQFWADGWTPWKSLAFTDTKVDSATNADYAAYSGGINANQPMLAAPTEANGIFIIDNPDSAITTNPVTSSSSIRKAIHFNWYHEPWQIGNVRGSGANSDGFGVTAGNDNLCFLVTKNGCYANGSKIITEGDSVSHAATADFATDATNAANLSGNAAPPTTLVGAADSQMRYDYLVINGTEGMFPSRNNANSMLTFCRYPDKFYSQLGLSGNGKLYYRINKDAQDFDVNDAWEELAFTSSNVASADKAVVVQGIETTDFSGTDLNESMKLFSGIPAGTEGLYPYGSNANAVLTINKHPGNYNSQLGFSSNGLLYYRNGSNEVLTTQPWRRIMFEGDNINILKGVDGKVLIQSGVGYASIGDGYLDDNNILYINGKSIAMRSSDTTDLAINPSGDVDVTKNMRVGKSLTANGAIVSSTDAGRTTVYPWGVDIVADNPGISFFFGKSDNITLRLIQHTADTLTCEGKFNTTGDAALGNNVTVGGDLTVNGVLSASSVIESGGGIYIPNNSGFSSRDSNRAYHRLLLLTGANELILGHDTASASYPTFIDGNAIYFRYSNAHYTGMALSANGNVTIGSTIDNGYKLDVNGTFNASGAASIGGDLGVRGGISVWGSVGIGEHLYLPNNANIYGTDTNGTNLPYITFTTDNDFVLGFGTATAGYNTYIDGNQIIFRSSRDHTNALHINADGDVYATKNLNVSGGLSVTGATSLSSIVTSSNAIIGGNLTVSGNQIKSNVLRDSNGSWLVGRVFTAGSERVGLGDVNINENIRLENKNGYVSLEKDGSTTFSGAVTMPSLTTSGNTVVNGDLLVQGNFLAKDRFLASEISVTRFSVNTDLSDDYAVNIDGDAYLSGYVMASGVTMYSQRSLKNVVDERGLSLDELAQIKPTRFTWKDGRDEKVHIGGIADDVQKVLPEAVHETAEGVLTMDYATAAFAVGTSLVDPVREHEKRIADLERENRELREELENIKRIIYGSHSK